ncbi:MAG: Asp-tRNA(Asn)/Glu-tRNA(Gln) amidotransferase subunit GatC [Proteobacteria bacterium]|nr:Asp-tRNA(Asn)/Glu-tRNA(Gln) amidotransferase subunit GatC [Pseudomonadota bacterium]
MAEINKELVKYIATLARLEFDEDELDDFTEKFRRILEYVEQLKELKVDEIEPTYHINVNYTSMREDEINQSLEISEVLKNAPDKKDNFFRVPRVVE